MTSYEKNLNAEAASWLIENEWERAEKFRRERIRHYKLIRDLLLDKLGTDRMRILEIGGGPMPISDLLRFESRMVVDPLSGQYRTVLPCPDHVEMLAEHLNSQNEFELVIATNSLDHVDRPGLAVAAMLRACKSGGYLAIMCAENNAITNPHPAHEHNLTAQWVHDQLDHACETVWELTYAEHGYRYGWVEYAGKRGQPAFALLMRNCSGYDDQ